MRRSLVLLITLASVGMTYIAFGLSIMLVPAAYFGYKFGKLIAVLYPFIKRYIDKKETLHFVFWYFLVAPTLMIGWPGIIIGIIALVTVYYALR